MATTHQQYMKELETGSGAAQAAANGAAVDVNKAADPSAITNSYYQKPLTSQTYNTQARPSYTQSQAVTDAANILTQHQQAKPGEYQSQYGDQIQGMIDSILNRDKFTYDHAADPMYQQYAQQYQRGGQMAMKDAMAESAALTGGYGNSYAQQVGQQTYQRYMEDLAGKIPELRDAAYRMYQNEGDTLRSNLGMLQGEDERAYGRHRDALGDWQNELNYHYNMFRDMSDAEYQRYMNDADAWAADRAYWYQKAYDDQQQRNWQMEFDAMYGGLGGGVAEGGGGGGGGGRRSSGSKPNMADIAEGLVAGARDTFGNVYAFSNAAAVAEAMERLR